MIGGDTGRPLRNSTGPGMPMPMPHSRPGRSRVAVVSSANSSSTRWRQRLRAGGDVGRLVPMAEDPAVEIGDRDVDAGCAEVGDEHVAGVRAERHLARRAAAGARPDLVVDDQAELDQLGDALGDDASAQTGASNQLGARARPCLPDLVKDRDERVERLAPDRRIASRDSPRSIIRACVGPFALDMQKYDPYVQFPPEPSLHPGCPRA